MNRTDSICEQARKLSRKEREQEAHRREILDAAERVFIRKGYHGATVEEIAQEAEFAVGTLYNFFKNKEELYAKVLERIAQDFMDRFEATVLAQDDPKEAIAALVELRLTHFDEHSGFFRVFIETAPGSHMDPARALPESCKELYQRYLAHVSNIFEKGIEIEAFRNADPLYLALSLEGIANACAAYWARCEPSQPVAERVLKVRDLLLEWVRSPGARL